MMYINGMSKEEIGKRIKQVREIELGMSQKELARLTGIPQTTLSKLERGKQDGSSDVALIAKHLKVNALWLSHADGPKHFNTGKVSNKGVPLTEDEYVHQYADPRCKYGPNSGSTTANELELMAFPSYVFAQHSIDASLCFGFTCADAAIGSAGDSMLVNTAETDPRQASGKTYAIKQGEALLLRNVFVSALGGYRLACDNPDKAAYPDEHVAPEQVPNVEIVGRVRYIGGAR